MRVRLRLRVRVRLRLRVRVRRRVRLRLRLRFRVRVRDGLGTGRRGYAVTSLSLTQVGHIKTVVTTKTNTQRVASSGGRAHRWSYVHVARWV